MPEGSEVFVIDFRHEPRLGLDPHARHGLEHGTQRMSLDELFNPYRTGLPGGSGFS